VFAVAVGTAVAVLGVVAVVHLLRGLDPDQLTPEEARVIARLRGESGLRPSEEAALLAHLHSPDEKEWPSVVQGVPMVAEHPVEVAPEEASQPSTFSQTS